MRKSICFSCLVLLTVFYLKFLIFPAILKIIFDSSKVKYIGSMGVGGRLGNQVWRLASLYGIGKFAKRKIFFQDFAFSDQREGFFVNITELKEIFPNIFTHIHVKNPPQVRNVSFAVDCCKYDNPEKLEELTDEYIQIEGDYLQSYKFFHPYRTEIKEIFECGPVIKSVVKKKSISLFNKNDNSHKLCVHIRREDFLRDLMLETTTDFLYPAVDYAYNYLSKQYNDTKISLLFIGDDRAFIKNLTDIKQPFHEKYYPIFQNPGDDMCFGINYCDSMILTASGSTFGWWMAYLMKSGGPVFYHSQVTDYGNHTKDIHDFDYFPPEWIKLSINEENRAFKETKWWYQRNNVLPDLPSKELR